MQISQNFLQLKRNPKALVQISIIIIALEA